MSQKEIEIILSRQLASYLAQPIFIIDPKGALLFYNEPAEKILGLRFEETGEMSTEELVRTFHPTNDVGVPLKPEEIPVFKALLNCFPSQGSFWVQGADGVRRRIESAAFPLIGQEMRLLGAMAIFWEAPNGI